MTDSATQYPLDPSTLNHGLGDYYTTEMGTRIGLRWSNKPANKLKQSTALIIAVDGQKDILGGKYWSDS